MSFCPKAVIFDMDGLLVDSEPVWHLMETQMVEAYGFTVNADAQRHLVGLRMDAYWSAMREIYPFTHDVTVLVDEAINRMNALIPTHVTPRAGAVELLNLLAAHNVPCAIASSSAVAIINTVVTSQKWEHYFITLASGDEVTSGKPSPDVYLEAARRLGVDPADCLTLEDSPNGARAAVAANMVCYAIPDTSHTSAEKFADITPHVYNSLHDVIALLTPCFEA